MGGAQWRQGIGWRGEGERAWEGAQELLLVWENSRRLMAAPQALSLNHGTPF
jgi:hypothetical protein